MRLTVCAAVCMPKTKDLKLVCWEKMRNEKYGCVIFEVMMGEIG